MEEDQESSYHEFFYVCNACEASEFLKSHRSNYVCPWCGEGVMQAEE